MKIHKHKQESDKWTYKLGRKIGKKISPIVSNRKFRIAVIAILLLILFIFIVPIKNNIITVIILILLLLASVIIKRKTR